MDVVQKTVVIKRLGDARPHLYSLTLEDFGPIAVKEHLLGHVLGLLLGTEAADALKTVIYGPSGDFETRVWINPPQAQALELLITEYGLLKE